MDDADDPNAVPLPTVTVLGGGIAGLTAAHELVERGFAVQVVESQPSSLEEYCCDVGGLAANQFTRVRAPLALLHENLRGNDLKEANKFRDLAGMKGMEATSERFPILRAIRFDKFVHYVATLPVPPPAPPDFDQAPRTTREPPSGVAIPAAWQDYWDEYGTYSSHKLGEVLKTIREASNTYMRQYFPDLAQVLALGTAPDDVAWTAGNYTKVAPANPAAGRRFVAREILVVQIVGYTDTDGTADQNRQIAQSWGTAVRTELIAMNDAGPPDLHIWQLADMLDTVPRGSVAPGFDQSTPAGRKRSNRVEFEVIEQLVPGEHGFRFFPAFYRHVFDTMRRTPMFDQAGQTQGATAFDQLVPTPDSRLALKDGKGPQDFQVRKIRSFRQMDDLLLRMLNDLQMTARDLLGLQFFTMRYLLSGRARREHEAEPISFVDYIQTVGGPAPDGTPRKSRFSAAALAFIDQAPRALAAMSARESDARTQYDIAAQLMTVQPDGPADDMTLNGPTTTSWLDHWKTYLKRQGVEFFIGTVDGLQTKAARLIPSFAERDNDGDPSPLPEDPDRRFRFPRKDGEVDRHRYVLATSFQHASSLIWDAFLAAGGAANPTVFAGPFQQLTVFDTQSGRRTAADTKLHEPARDTATGKPPAKYPLRTISGLQYFFPEEYRFGRGNVFFVATPWALTSISQFPYWRDRVRPVGPLLGQITVDVGNWHAFYPLEQPNHTPGHPAWYSSRQEIATKTWSQIKEGLPTDYAQLIKPPAYFHIDRNIIFGEYTDVGSQGSAVFRIVSPDQPFTARSVLPTLRVTEPPRWHRHNAEDAGGQFVPADFNPEIAITADWVGRWITRSVGEAAFFVPIPRVQAGAPDKAAPADDVLVSPRALDTKFVIAFRGSSAQPFYISIEDHKPVPFKVREPAERLNSLRDAVGSADDRVQVDPAGDDHTTFVLTRGDTAFHLGVANVDGAIELLDGPVLEVNDVGHVLRLANALLPASGRATLAAVRCNAVLSLSAIRPESGLPGIQPLRIYGIALDIGVGNPVDPQLKFQWEATPADTVTSVRDGMLNLMQGVPDKLLVQPRDTSSLVMSPVSFLMRAVISFLGTSTTPYFVFVDGQPITLVAGAKSMADRRDELAGKLGGFRVEVVDPGDPAGTGALSVASLVENVSFRIGVLNVDRLIELVGAPALTVATKDFVLEQPDQGFVVLRNDAEYLINVPDEFQWRPGVFRGAAAADIPTDYTKLGRLFGNTNTEIYSGHPPRVPLLQNWVTAGTYTATYTRITTMESANESGRHAAAAIIYKEIADAQADGTQRPTLVADLPPIWKVEENELADLKFFTDLDDALFADGLPHVLDILSLTPLIGMLLEADLQDDKVRTLLQKLKTIMNGATSSAHQGIKAGGHLFSLLVGAYADLTESVIGTVSGTDPTSVALNRMLQQVEEARQSYKSIWGG